MLSLLRSPRRRLAVGVALATALAPTVLVTTQARADTAPVPPETVQTVSADALPTVQIDGVVWAQIVVGNKVYATGKFAKARPAGAAAGTNETARANILAYDITTGQLDTTFVASLNAQGLGLAASADGKTVYVVGDFTSVNGVTRNRIVALNATTGAVITSFAPSLNARARGVAVLGTTVYAGGNFTTASGQSRSRLAAFNGATGAVLSWAPSVNQEVFALTAPAGKGAVIAGGRFTTLNGASTIGMGSVDATTGAALPWAVNQIVQNYGRDAAIYSLSNDGETVYGAGYGYLVNNDPTTNANLESVFAASAVGGNLVWVSGCRGDTYDAEPVSGVVYNVGHPHDCDMIGGNPQTEPWTYQRAIAFNAALPADGRLNVGGAFSGRPAPEYLHWLPTLQSGTYTGQGQAAWDVAGNGNYVVLGGEFPRVNGVAQQGLVRFAVKSVAPNKEGPQGHADLKPSGTSLAAGTLRLSWQAAWDRDNKRLTYELLRGATLSTATVISTQSVNSTWWSRPSIAFTDRTATPGSTQTYRVRVKDPLGNTVTSATTAVTVPGGTASTSEYADAVTADGPTSYWRLGEDTGATAYDWAAADDVTLAADATRGMPGALSGDADTATGFSGSATVPGVSTSQLPGPQTFSVEAWFKTTSTSGGKIIGFGNSKTGDSNNYDRHVYLTNDGKVVFGVYNNNTYTLTSGKSYNDGKWHQVVGTMGSSGLTLYVDGAKISSRSDTSAAQPFNGYWRIGGDNINGWPGQPSSNKLAGTIDEVSVYPVVLGADRVAAHYTAGGGTAGPVVTPKRPSDAYGQAVWDAKADLYLRLDEKSGSTATDTMTASDGASYDSNVALGQAASPANSAGTSIGLPGSSSTVVAKQLTSNPQVFSLEAWFKTTTTTGGRIVGFGNAQSGSSGNYDRHLYMLDDGRLRYGIWIGSTAIIDSTAAYNDGAWHHVVVTQGPGGQQMYVDGASVATGTATTPQPYDGYWRIGSDNTWGGASSNDFAGAIDEVAVYPTVLSSSTVLAHYQAAVPAANQAPVAAFTSSATNLSVAFDGSGSTDADGTIASYAWDFGDSSATGTGATPTHVYSSAGTYSVKLTVTDDKGATNQTTKSVTVTAAPPATALAADAFGRTSSAGWGTADTGGAWTTSNTTSTYTVGSGVGSMRMAAAGSGTWARLNGVSSSATDSTVTLTTDKVGTGGGIYLNVVGRRISAGSEYTGRVKLLANNSVGIAVTRVVSGTETVLGGETVLSGVTYAAGTQLKVRLQVEGTGTTTLRLKVWPATGTEPATWQVVRTDTTAALQAAGAVSLKAYLSSTATNAPVVARFDDYTVTAI